jgi:hypothetical protein
MNIVMHGYAGHLFKVQLSRQLARHGQRVTHQYCTSFTTGKGAVMRNTDDPDGFSVEPLSMAASSTLGRQILSGSSWRRFSPDRRPIMSWFTRGTWTKTFDRNEPECCLAAISTARNAVLNGKISQNSTAVVAMLNFLSPRRLTWLGRRGTSAHHLGGDRWPR